KIMLMLIMVSGSMFAGVINIAVAANVSYAIEDLKKEFHKLHPDTKVRITLGGSGKLTAQIKNGAPYDLFMSANMKYPRALYESGDALTLPYIYAQGSLAYLSHTQRDFTQGINIVKNTEIKKIAVANPKTAPYGLATQEALQNAHIYKDAVKKFVYAESISQTVSYTVIAADIGFIAKSSLYSPKMAHFKEGIHWADVDSDLYTPINQGMVILRRAKGDNEVKDFYDFIVGSKAKKIFKEFGYLVP
ncbi:MAG: molybdate ABC transporter substrate-binding protein, partial [Campylobacterota bacterium]|nr:molybdate ABC transporter substrate-binding protein [Campylobacterota bacterium]